MDFGKEIEMNDSQTDPVIRIEQGWTTEFVKFYAGVWFTFLLNIFR